MRIKRIRHYIKRWLPYSMVLKYEQEHSFRTDFERWKLNASKIEFDNECKFDSIVSIEGLGYSGSSAMIDLLREYDDCLVHGLVDIGSKANWNNLDLGEVRFIKEVGGLIDLDTVISSPTTQYAKQALERFEYMIYRNKIYHYGQKYRDLIYTFYAELTDSNSKNNINIISKENYYLLCQKFIASIFNLQYDGTKRLLVLDQVMPSLYTGVDYCRKFIPNIKNIIVWRDPRDVYITAKRLNIQWLPHDSAENFINAKKYAYQLLTKQDDYMLIRFEDLIYNYDATVSIIEKHLNLGQHTHPKDCFDNSISRRNTKLWETATDINADDCNKIYQAFPELCYNK